MKYHPDSGPLQYDTAEKLDAALGDHMRAVYPGLKYHTLHTVLRMRRKAVLVSRGVLRQWCDVYASVSSSVQAAASSARAVTKRVLKRPAAPVAGGVLHVWQNLPQKCDQLLSLSHVHHTYHVQYVVYVTSAGVTKFAIKM